MASWIVLLSLPAQLMLASANETRWLDDYGTALRQAKSQQAPLLVVIEDPSSQDQRIEQIRFASATSQDELLSHYIVCRVDVRTPYGQSVAKVFKADQLPHTSIIDNTAKVQLFIKSGNFTTDEWHSTLAKYQEGQRVQPVTVSSGSSSRFGGRICST